MQLWRRPIRPGQARPPVVGSISLSTQPSDSVPAIEAFDCFKFPRRREPGRAVGSPRSIRAPADHVLAAD